MLTHCGNVKESRRHRNEVHKLAVYPHYHQGTVPWTNLLLLTLSKYTTSVGTMHPLKTVTDLIRLDSFTSKQFCIIVSFELSATSLKSQVLR